MRIFKIGLAIFGFDQGGSTNSPVLNHYQILGVENNANQEELEEAFRKGPDGSDVRELNKAYEILRDPKKRAKYDEDLCPLHIDFLKEFREPKTEVGAATNGCIDINELNNSEDPKTNPLGIVSFSIFRIIGNSKYALECYNEFENISRRIGIYTFKDVNEFKEERNWKQKIAKKFNELWKKDYSIEIFSRYQDEQKVIAKMDPRKSSKIL